MAFRFNLSDVMISYSRRDKAFVYRLDQALRADGMEIWVDWEDIPPTADWWNEIQAGIEAAHTVVFIITPSSVRSEVCTREIEHAVQQHKRLVPVIYQELTAEDEARLHPAVQGINWVFFRPTDDFQQAYHNLLAALETDLEHKKLHTRLLVRAREWEERGHSGSLLLRGDDLRSAERWLEQSIQGKTPTPTELQVEYIRASRTAAQRQTQRLAGGLVTALLLVIMGVLFALAQSQRANAETSNALVAAQFRSTEEGRANAGLAEAATAQQIAKDSANAAASAQYQVIGAQTQEQLALQNSGNSQTQAYIAQQNALTATVLEGQAHDMAATAQQQQQTADAARDRALSQAQQAQQTAQQGQAAQSTAQQEAGATGTAVAEQARPLQQTVDAAQTAAAGALLTAAAVKATITVTMAAVQTQGAAVAQTVQGAVETANAVGTGAAAQLQTAAARATDARGEFDYRIQQATQDSLKLGTQKAELFTAQAIDMQHFGALYNALTETAEYLATAQCVVSRNCS
jgi:hypothetical protein